MFWRLVPLAWPQFGLGSEWCQAFCSLQNLHVGEGLKSSTSSFRNPEGLGPNSRLAQRFASKQDLSGQL